MLSAARRLAMIVACEVVLVALALLRDPRIGGLPGISAGLGLALFVASLPPLARATHIVRAGQRPIAATAAKVYRTSARNPDRDVAERAATRYSAAALMLLAVAGAVTVVAAASR
jgi:hypothetical protein